MTTNLVTLAGEGSRFKINGIETPKPLIPINGKPMIVQSVECLPKADKHVFVCREEHLENFDLDKILSDNFNNSEFVCVKKTTEGQACTAELGIRESSIQPDDSILISSCDYGLDWNEEKYNLVKNESDVVVWSTTNNEAFSKNPSSYSWLALNGNMILKTYVKQSIFSDPYNSHAIVGTFYFSKSKHFLDSVQTIYEKDIRSNGEYYIDNIFNTIENLSVRSFTVDNYHCWGTPEDLKDYENKILG